MTKKRTPSPEPPENGDEPGRPSAPPPGAPGLRDATETLPEDGAGPEGLGNPDRDGYDWIKGRRPKR